MVYRIFVEKKEGLDNEARGLLSEGRNLLGIDTLENVRLFNRYDAENIAQELFGYCVKTVFSEPQLDNTFDALALPGAYVFAGIATPETKGKFGLHSNKFVLEESVIPNMAAVFAQMAVDFIEKGSF